MGANDLMNDIMLRLHDKLSDEQLRDVMNQIRMCTVEYSIDKVGTEIAIRSGLPKELGIYLISKKIEGRSEKTLELYKLRLESMLYTINKPLKDITSNDIRLYLYNFQSARNISDRTLDGLRVILNGFFKWCSDEGHIDQNPCASVRPVHYEEKLREPLTDLEMEILRRGCVSARDHAIVETLYCSGCRCGELVNLNRSDIDLETREIHLFGKGKKHRMSCLSARGVLALQEYLATRTDDDPCLFARIRRPYVRLQEGGVESVIECIAQRAGLENICPHRIRHTFATDAIDRGMDVTELQLLMGHSSIDTTMIYAKVKPEAVKHHYNKCIV